MSEFGFRDAVNAFKQGFKAGPTEPGNWRYLEKFGRFQGVGEVRGEIELPRGKVTLGSEAFEEVDDLEVELAGPDGNPVALERPDGSFSELDRGTHNLFRIGYAAIEQPGLHTLRVRAPGEEEPLLITVGEEPSAGEALKQVIPGRKLFRRLRGED